MKRLAILAALAALIGCSPAPRAASYFRAHPNEAGRVVAGCAAGAHRGAECDNAKAAQAQTQSDTRLSLYKHSF
jgi:hypothetical protein